ncbi:MAG: hypothetical protein A2504_16125 [Bdellovibrionales bacterium RIFOXYD12_FULL_39_22]|nr:MAG: hypothetical protein A2385_08035 [Bdellovibrionales bacterium RIFOXYB1_FULL_39_21]OFZ42993.1 MAG: hypothetical protein A2485_11190 [Bdellovibrionales bacterium RIFOXYC12_FULL_39_17]OFZ50921.1 MAG: hypothetical protein A2404_06950 [Bdellovibrionales bacterium RIFOXYC1_FULL_39_130]OFZ78144.1 MAG: hypothetical protein A2560_02120 [Bdellovibrionales bacterium RIFOXYD1_FULL_39_84]OFZ94012.1 MAG: hypothetical protein A2504_16125 [Bdellovibrionales bacterium RIFOXYD12_FULL_39_22]HLE10464.1 DU
MAIADEQHHTPLPETLKITKLTLNGEKTFLGNIDIPWIKEILSELEREYFEINAEENDNSSSNLIIDLSVIRKKNDEFGDHLIIRGTLSGNYKAPCVRCLDSTTQNINHQFRALFMSELFEKAQTYEEETEVFCAEETMDLYFYSNNNVNFNDLIHEQLFLNIPQFPLHDENCRGLCPICGTNLNHDSCSCQRPED